MEILLVSLSLGRYNAINSVILQERDGENVATSVETATGEIYNASKEVIISTSAYRIPQLLMLSGVGPAKELPCHDIPVLVDSLEVGRNLHDHFCLPQWWKLRHSEHGLAMGTLLWSSPAYATGLPLDWNVTLQTPAEDLGRGLRKDEREREAGSLKDHPCLDPAFAHTEIILIYALINEGFAGFEAPMDGTHISTLVLLMAPTSRGQITLANADRGSAPVINPNYPSTEVDHHEEVNENFQRAGIIFMHPGGTAGMGKVVNTQLRVIRVRGLQVADASILPVPIIAHYQAMLYAVAEKAADLILGEVR
ncbi:hypothetical protein BJY00DRAFT_313661 [Aspergillus carlsbadensis]|nr:hypothetical protein BJY00DRAFT_313661 [Aspergillus carlsbadensis]